MIIPSAFVMWRDLIAQVFGLYTKLTSQWHPNCCQIDEYVSNGWFNLQLGLYLVEGERLELDKALLKDHGGQQPDGNPWFWGVKS